MHRKHRPAYQRCREARRIALEADESRLVSGEAGRAGRWRTRRRIAAGIALLLALFLVVLWLVRRPIAQHFIDRELARRGVPARYRIADLGFGRQRLTDVVIGDPARPDLIADWIETDTVVDLGGYRVAELRAGHVRMRARLENGRVTLGSIDRLLPAPAATGQPFRLPALGLDLADVRVALATPAGPVALGLSGRGQLAGSFQGQVSGGADRLAMTNCAADAVRFTIALKVRDGVPEVAGPAMARRIACYDVTGERPYASIRGSIGKALDRLDGELKIAAGAVSGMGVRAGGIDGTIAGSGKAGNWSGRIDLGAIQVEGTPGRAAAARVSSSVRHDAGGDVFGADPAGLMVQVNGASLKPEWRTMPARWALAARGSPLAPIADRVAVALNRAGADFNATARLRATRVGQWRARLEALDALSRSGARVAVAATLDVTRQDWWQVPTDAVAVTVGGGGLPSLAADLAARRAGEPLNATVRLTPYAAGSARLALTPVTVGADRRGWRASTLVNVSGPLGDGRIDGVTLPLRIEASGQDIAINPGCTPVGWRQVATGGLVLAPATLRLCAEGQALATLHAGRFSAGARVGSAQLAGRLGGTPLALAWRQARLASAGLEFALSGVEARLGDPARPTRLDAGQLTGRFGSHGPVGRFADAAGQIGAVPLLLSGGEGSWQFGGGRLAVNGAIGVSDTADPARFRPLAARDVVLTLADGLIRATGTLQEPASGTRVAEVAIDHRLATGAGEANMSVTELAFTQAFQPDRLTPLTYGVIADVRGTVDGNARIAWSPAGVTSTGTFRTAGTDLAAAFGPVTGLAAQVRFTDLLSLQSAPGQVATIASINPGVPVENGRVRFQILPDTRVQVEGGRWPFAGGTLTLEPTLLDFGTAGERRMTFTLDGVAADRFLQQFDFKNLTATGVFDGTLPMVFDATGGRIEQGRLTVRPGGGTLAYVGEISRENVGFWGNLAFGALRSLRYRDLTIAMNGPLAGEMVTDVRFSGVSQGQGATSNFLIRRLQRLPFVFNVRIKAPFRGLIDSAQSFYDPKRLIDRNLPALIEQQNKAGAPVQPPASEPVP